MKTQPTLARVRELLRYEPETGEFWWIGSGRGHALRKPAGSFNSKGYRVICIDGCMVSAHRLAWLLVHGVWPSSMLDHVNGQRADNRISNLRESDYFANQQNQRRAHRDSKTGLIGARPAHDGRFRAEIRVAGKKYDLGRYETAEAAHAAYVEAKRQLHAACSI